MANPSTAPAGTPEAVAATPCPFCGGPLSSRGAITGRDILLGVPGEFSVATCGKCGSGTTFPPVADDELVSLYEGDYQAHDEWQPNALIRALIMPAKRLHAWRAMNAKPFSALADRNGRLLDVGCGRGDQSLMLKNKGWEVSAVEPDPDACAFVAKRGIDAHCGTLRTVELPPETFDVVVFHHALEHVEHPSRDLAEAKRLLKPGGLLLIAMPNFGCWQRRAFRDRWFNLELPRHRTHSTSQGLRAVVDKAGFTDVQITTGTTLGAIPCSLVYVVWGRMIVKRPLSVRVFVAASVLLVPLMALINRLAGGGDVLNLVAVKPAASEG